jgi:ATP-binding protein involved in chromosome partitioning
MPTSRDIVAKALTTVLEPELGRSIIDLGMVSQVTLEGTRVAVLLKLSNPAYQQREELASRVEQALAALSGVDEVSVDFEDSAPDEAFRGTEEDPVPGVRHVVLVMSGKGGVGKSTVATNLALALARSGNRVGLLDADIYGPSIPTMLGISGRPLSRGSQIEPLSRFGIKLMSIGFLLDDEKAAVVWRGPMLHGALLQFLKDVAWGALDYLILDLPPGTGDVALTLSQRVRASGAIIVTTPQEVALQDVYKSVSMCQKVGIPVLGVVENESYFVCTECSHHHEIFGSGGGQKVADHAGAPLLAKLPMDRKIREWGDAGTPIVEASPGSDVALAFLALAEALGRLLEESRGPGVLEIDRSGGVNRHLPITR